MNAINQFDIALSRVLLKIAPPGLIISDSDNWQAAMKSGYKERDKRWVYNESKGTL